ncbi:MAG: alpha-N-arabinofuranosidase [Oscillospiraceae bacterium]|nr:alpha-N-arabinofuranosidase [Oscillospiraceae bacterium]
MRELFINTAKKGSKINKNIYGHFAEHLGHCIYGGIFVGKNSIIPNMNGIRTDIVKALREIKAPVLRWPGGCFADEYHWIDGIGPLENRKKMVNTHWGGVTEDNSFGTHEFLDLCNQIGCEPYITGNVGSGTVREMSEWVEYITFDGISPMAQLRKQNGREKSWKLKYFGVGNENWGCGGNMRPEYYADVYRNYQTYVRQYDHNKIFKIACGPNTDDLHWTEVMMKIAGNYMDGLSLHYYTSPGGPKGRGSAVNFERSKYYETLQEALRMEKLIESHSIIMDKYDPEKHVGLVVDEWGNWFDVQEGTNPGFLFQQNTMRDAIVAALTLNIFNSHSNRVVMANIAQTVNVLQSMILTEGEKMILTPTYHVFDLYKDHQDAELLDSYVEAQEIGVDGFSVPDLHVSASKTDDTIHVTLVNTSDSESREILCRIGGASAKSFASKILTGAINAHNDFDNPNQIKPKSFDDIKMAENGLCFTILPCSCLEITIKV